MGVLHFSQYLIIAVILSSIFSTTPVYSYYADAIDLSSLHEILLQQITSFPLSQFEFDPELEQQVDKINHTTSYKFLEEKVDLFTRSVDDSYKKVVVLTRKEDKIPFKKAKRGYVVFTKNSVDATYYGEFAFIRPTSSPYDKNTVLVNGGVRSFIEWIPFDGHWVKGRVPKREIAMSCVSSVLVSCLFNQSLLDDKKLIPASTAYIPDTPTTGEIAETEILSWTNHDESDPDENYDYYADLTLGTITGHATVDKIIQAIEKKVRYISCVAAPEVCNFNDTELPTIGILPITSSIGLKNGSVIGRRKRETENPAGKSPEYYPGWKTQYVTVAPGSYLITPKPAEFYGFGNCPFNNTLGSDYLFNNATSVDDFFSFYLTILRVGCISTMQPLLEETLKSGILNVNYDKKVFEVRFNHKYLTQVKLTTDEFVHLGVAFEFAMFTQNYATTFSPVLHPKTANNNDTDQTTPSPVVTTTPTPTPVPINYTTPTGKPGSQSIAFITTVILDYLKTIRVKARPHMIHLTRSMAQNTRFILFKLAQDAKNLAQVCSSEICAKDKTVNFNDRAQVMALNQFIKRGLGPIDKGSVDMDDAFIQFYKDNEPAIEKFVAVYATF